MTEKSTWLAKGMIKKSTLLAISFYVMAAIIFSNINGLVYSLYSIAAPFSSFILVSCLTITFFLFRYERITLPHHLFNFTIIGYFVIGGIMWCFFSHLHNPNVPYYHVFRKQAPALLLLYAFYKYVVYEGNRNGLGNLLVFITIFAFLITLTIPFGELIGLKKFLIYESKSRQSGVFASPNKAGEHINYTMALVLFLTINSKRWSWLFIALLPMVLYSTLLTFSKSAIISALLLIVFFLFVNVRGYTKLGKSRRRKLGILLILVFGVVIYSIPIITEFVSKLNTQQMARLTQVQGLLQGRVDTETTTQRSSLWETGFGIIKEFPITGHGFGSFSELPGGSLGIHNTYLMILGESGIFPFILFMSFIVLLYYRSFFWVRDPGYQFLAVSLWIIITIQVYMTGNGGIKTSETLAMTGILLAILKLMKGKLVHHALSKPKRRILWWQSCHESIGTNKRKD